MGNAVADASYRVKQAIADLSLTGEHIALPTVRPRPRLMSSGSWVFLAIVLLCLLGSAFDVYMIARQTWQNSDSVQGFLEAKSILQGNILLNGWHLTRDNYVFTDAPFFIAYEFLFGARSEALAVVPSVIYVLIVVACLAASLRSLKLSRHNVVALATVVLLVGLPSLRTPSTDPLAPAAPLLLADYHAASILFSLVGLLLSWPGEPTSAIVPSSRQRSPSYASWRWPAIHSLWSSRLGRRLSSS